LVDILNEEIQFCLEDMISTSQYSNWIYKLSNPYLRALRVGGNDVRKEHEWRWGNKKIIPFRGEVNMGHYFKPIIV